MSEIINKSLRWLIFGVVVALVPLVFSYLDVLMKHKTPSFEKIVGDGGLLLIISAVCAGSLEEIIGSGQKALLPKIISSGVTVIILILSSLLFAAIAEGKVNGGVDEAIVADLSLRTFIIGLLPCAACVALSEL